MKATPKDSPLLSGSQRKKLEAVYRKAEYRVVIGSSALEFRIGEHNAAAERVLLNHLPARSHWSILTPCNPRSQEATAEINSFYYHELRDALATRNNQWIAAINHDPLGSWPDEPGFAIADADPLWLQELGKRFLQNAYVTTRIGEPLRLVWVA